MGRIVEKISQRPFLPLALACATLFYLPLGLRALWDPLEGHVAETVLRFPNSSLFHALTALSLRLFGMTEFAARLVSATFGLLTVWATYRFGVYWRDDRTGLLAGTIVATSLGFFFFTQVLVPDIGLTFWSTLGLFAGAGLLIERSQDRSRRFAYALAFAIAGGVLTQGWFPGVLPLAPLGLIYATLGGRQSRTRVPWKAAVIFCGLLTIPWSIWALIAHPSSLDFPQRVRPFYGFIPMLLLCFLPWSIFLPKVAVSWLSHRHVSLQRDPLGAVLVTWVLISMITGWILPVFPALALLVAHEFEDEVWDDLTPAWVGNGLIGLILFFLGVLWMLKAPGGFLHTSVGGKIVAAHGDALAMTLGIGIFILVGVWGMRRTLFAVGGILWVQVMILTVLSSLAPQLDLYRSSRYFAERFLAQAGPSDTLVLCNEDLPSLTFYLNRPVTIIDATPEAVRSLAPGTWGIINVVSWQAVRPTSLIDMFQITGQAGNRVLFRKDR